MHSLSLFYCRILTIPPKGITVIPVLYTNKGRFRKFKGFALIQKVIKE